MKPKAGVTVQVQAVVHSAVEVPSSRGEVQASPAVSLRAPSLVEEKEESPDGVTSAVTTTAATTTPVTKPAVNTVEGAMRVEEEDHVSEEPGSPKSPEPTPRQEEKEEEKEPGRKKQTDKSKDKRKAFGASKQTWSLPDNVQQDLVKWLTFGSGAPRITIRSQRGR